MYTFWYNFDTVLYKFLETGTSDICLIYIVQLLRFSGFSLYPLSFFLSSPVKDEGSNLNMMPGHMTDIIRVRDSNGRAGTADLILTVCAGIRSTLRKNKN